MRATERAGAALQRVEDRVTPRFETLARLLLRAEGMASSYIEGVRAPAELAAVAEVDAEVVDATSAWVADNLAVVDASLAHARSGAALRTADLHGWHTTLMAHGALPGELVGRYRRLQNWIGGATPREAAYVHPPAEHVSALMRDLLAVANAARLDPVTQAAVVHAQFEATIHTATATAGWGGSSSAGCWPGARGCGSRRRSAWSWPVRPVATCPASPAGAMATSPGG
ncbi:MAG TPA: hypothetical protein VM390_10775 [Acidimicrobiales bacterium]|nr:hypothetical protein [Acidimicrobiales bacterium]